MPQTSVTGFAQRTIKSTQANFPPTEGVFFVGDRIVFTDPTLNGPEGRICVTAGDYAGTPPVWQQFGYVGDPTTGGGTVPFEVAPAPTGGDDSATIQAWIDGFPTSGVDAYISGDYQLSDGLVINDHNVTFRGIGAGQAGDATHNVAAGARFTAIAGGNLATGTPMLQVQLAGNTQPVHNVRIERIAFDGATIATGDGIHYRSYRGVIDDVKVYRCGGVGIRAEGYVGWDLYETLIHKAEVADCSHGLYFDEGATDIHVTNCILYDNNINWELAGGGSVQASGCHLYNATVDNLFFNGAGSRSKFWGFKIEGAGRNGINIDSTVGGYSDLQFVACNITSNTDTSTINTEDSVVIQGVSGVTRTSFVGCNFSTKSATQANNPRYFIYLNTVAQDTLIAGCNFGPSSHYGTAPVGGTGTALRDSEIIGNQGCNEDHAHRSGSTTNRPTGRPVGYSYYDTTIGLPIWHVGAEAWEDATGTTA